MGLIISPDSNKRGKIRLEIEKDMRPTILGSSLVCICVGVIVYFISNLFLAIVAVFLTMPFFLQLNILLSKLRIPADAKLAAHKAISAFKEKYPDCLFSSVAIRAVENNRYVFSIRYYDLYESKPVRTRPQPRRYFEVPRNSNTNIVELDCREWWPGLK